MSNPLQLQLRRSEGRTPVGMAAQQHLLPWLAELSTEGLTVRVSPEEGLIGSPDDSSDLLDTIRKMSVKIVWNADSTFDASNADVSINESPFSALEHGGQVQRFVSWEKRWTVEKKERTREGLCLFGRYCAQVLQIALVPDEHDDDV